MILGIALTAIGTYVLAATVGGGEQFFFQQYFSPTLILASVMVFLLLLTVKPPSVQKLTRPSTGNKLVKIISENSLPLFLFHVMILESLKRGYFGFTLNGNTVNSTVGIPLATVLTLFICLAIIVPLKKIPFLKKLLG
jgi:surface polysaccharide O-acyltransferase-like enzyme